MLALLDANRGFVALLMIPLFALFYLWIRHAEKRPGKPHQETVRALRASVTITSVIGQSVKLVVRARGAVGPCPFHADSPASLSVDDVRGFFHCFHCGAHGDVFDWVMKVQGVTFAQAVKLLALRFPPP